MKFNGAEQKNQAFQGPVAGEKKPFFFGIQFEFINKGNYNSLQKEFFLFPESF